MNKENLEFYKECIDIWGVDAQIKMCIEEMSELTKEFCKYYRKGEMDCDPEIKSHICEEIADVQNMIDQMQLIFGIDEVEKIREYKIERTKKRLKEEQ